MREQREAKPLSFTVRDLSREDLAELEGERKTQTVAKLRDVHHRVARLIASGVRPGEVAERTGYSLVYISGVLSRDPAFQELVSAYREKVIEAYVEEEREFISDATRLRTKALRVIEDHFDRADDDPDAEPIPLSKALAVAEFTADRTGFGKQTTKLNVNADFASMLEKAHARRTVVIESRAVPHAAAREVESGPGLPHSPPTPAIPVQSEVRVPAPRLSPPRAPASASVERAAEPFRRRA